MVGMAGEGLAVEERVEVAPVAVAAGETAGAG